jgi:hypothetical protein
MVSTNVIHLALDQSAHGLKQHIECKFIHDSIGMEESKNLNVPRF